MRLCLKNPKESIKRLLELINRFYKVAGSSKKQESSRKVSISALLTMPNPLTVWITIKCGKLGTRWEYQTITSWEIDGETVETVSDFIVLGSKTTADGDCSHEIMTLTPWKKSYDQPR